MEPLEVLREGGSILGQISVTTFIVGSWGLIQLGGLGKRLRYTLSKIVLKVVSKIGFLALWRKKGIIQ